MSGAYATEAALVADFLQQLETQQTRHGGKNEWTVYPETAGWDLLLVHSGGMQLGLEAKLTLNAKVIDQSLDRQHARYDADGPDWRGVLVPSVGRQLHLGRICKALGIGIIALREQEPYGWRYINLPHPEGDFYNTDWPQWLPSQRCTVPDYIPDVVAGVKSPVKLSEWKIKAIKLMILLERRGQVHRSDMRALQISPTRWTDRYNGFLAPSSGGYVRCDATPDLKAQHPENWAQIEADFDRWNPYSKWDAAA